MKNKPEEQEIVKVAEFKCMQYKNVENITLALSRAGRFVRILQPDNITYIIEIFELK